MMKRYTLIMIMVCAAAVAQGADYLERAVYWCHQNGHTEATLAGTEFLNMGKGKGVLSYIVFQADSWKFAGPSKATLDALDGPIVDAWIDAYKKGRACDYAQWENAKLRAVIKLMVIEINKLRQNAGLPTYEKPQIVTALKAEM
jgi:hypothetical protein